MTSLRITDRSLPEGEVRAVPGRSGLGLRNYEIYGSSKSGFAVEELPSDVLLPALSEIIIEGTKPPEPPLSTGSYVMPAEGTVSSRFGLRAVTGASVYHEGWDISNYEGSPVTAADGGIVLLAGYEPEGYGGFGNIVVIEHENGDTTWYAHLKSVSAEPGAEVRQGAQIGEMGATGRTTGTHLHFEYHPAGGAPADPAAILTTD
jgi:murein DD-endopeptidase MepM/ murein hydrolase activator NlpD